MLLSARLAGRHELDVDLPFRASVGRSSDTSPWWALHVLTRKSNNTGFETSTREQRSPLFLEGTNTHVTEPSITFSGVEWHG